MKECSIKFCFCFIFFSQHLSKYLFVHEAEKKNCLGCGWEMCDCTEKTPFFWRNANTHTPQILLAYEKSRIVKARWTRGFVNPPKLLFKPLRRELGPEFKLLLSLFEHLSYCLQQKALQKPRFCGKRGNRNAISSSEVDFVCVCVCACVWWQLIHKYMLYICHSFTPLSDSSLVLMREKMCAGWFYTAVLCCIMPSDKTQHKQDKPVSF